MRKSCLVALVLLAAILLAVSVSLRRCYLAATEGSDPRAEVVSESLSGAGPDGGNRETFAAALLSLQDVGTEGLEGLALETLRPLTTEPLRIYGLAAVDESLYFAGCDDSGRCGNVYVLNGSGLTPAGQVQIDTAGYPTPGGILLHGDELWLWHRAGGGDDRTQVVVLDRESLQEVSRYTLQGAASTLAVLSDGTLRGTSADGTWFYQWASDRDSFSRRANTTGARYDDCDLLLGSLVCSGVREDGAGVLDVLDAVEFSLLARHLADARTEGGDRVVGGAWAYRQGRFMFVPEGGDLPILWIYALDGVPLGQYIPSVDP